MDKDIKEQLRNRQLGDIVDLFGQSYRIIGIEDCGAVTLMNVDPSDWQHSLYGQMIPYPEMISYPEPISSADLRKIEKFQQDFGLGHMHANLHLQDSATSKLKEMNLLDKSTVQGHPTTTT